MSSLVAACRAGVDRPYLAEDKPNLALAQRAEQNYREARKRFQSNTNDGEGAWQFGRACFDWADLAEENDRRKELDRLLEAGSMMRAHG